MRDQSVDARTAARRERAAAKRRAAAAAKKQRVAAAKRELTRATGRWRTAEHRVLVLQADGASEQRVEDAKAASRDRAHELVAAREALKTMRSANGGRR